MNRLGGIFILALYDVLDEIGSCLRQIMFNIRCSFYKFITFES